MSLTPSNMMPLGTVAPDFSLSDSITGKTMSLNDLKSDVATVVMFICNHCPFVKYLQNEMVNIAKKYQDRGVSFIAINSNDVESYPDDDPEHMKIIAEQHGYTFPYLFDKTQNVAKSYIAACTPDFYVFDKNLQCVYRGQFDDARPGNQNPITGKDLTGALDAVLLGNPVSDDQKPSQGCNIKWKEVA